MALGTKGYSDCSSLSGFLYPRWAVGVLLELPRLFLYLSLGLRALLLLLRDLWTSPKWEGDLATEFRLFLDRVGEHILLRWLLVMTPIRTRPSLCSSLHRSARAYDWPPRW